VVQAEVDEMMWSLGEDNLPATFSEHAPSGAIGQLSDQLKESKGDANVMFEWVQDVSNSIDRVKEEHTALLVRKAGLLEERDKQARRLSELSTSNASLSKALDKAQQGQQQDQKQLLASQEWYDAKRRNKGLTEEVEKLRHALQMVRQQGEELALMEADEVVEEEEELEDGYKAMQNSRMASLLRKGVKKTMPSRGDALAAVATSAVKKARAHRAQANQQQAQMMQQINSKKEELRSQAAAAEAQTHMDLLQRKLNEAERLRLEASQVAQATPAPEGEDAGPAMYKSYMAEQRLREATQKVEGLQKELEPASRTAQEANAVYAMQQGITSSLEARSPAGGKLTMSALTH